MGDCDRKWELDVYREGRLGPRDAESFERHLRACSDCKLRNANDERLRMLGKSLPRDAPGELALRRLRTRILRDVATGATPRDRSPWIRVALAGGLVLAVVGGGWAVAARRTAPRPGAVAAVAAAAPAAPEPLAGSVDVVKDARWSQSRQDGVERVTLDDGTLAVHVRHQRAGERFLVMLPDGELEVRGTTFDVTVDGGATRRVHVDEGLVELRLRGAQLARLEAGETWSPAAPQLEAPAVVAVPDKPAGSRVAPPASRQAPAPADDGAKDYADAVQLLRSGRGDDAAAAFHAFLLAHPSASQAEDASFLEAVALARAGRGDAAALAAEHHLASFPASFHRKEAAILVARAAAQRGDCARARAALASWLTAAPPDALDAELRSALGSCQAP